MVGLILEWVIEGSWWLKFCGFFFPPVVVASSGQLLVVGVSGRDSSSPGLAVGC